MAAVILRQLATLAAAASMAATTGCRSMANAKWSSTVPPGKGRTTLGLDVDVAQPDAKDYALANYLVEYRTGVARQWDLGLRVRGFDVSAGPRRQIVRSDDVELAVGAAATVGFPLGSMSRRIEGFATAVEVPILLGLNVSRRSQLGFGAVPKIRYTRELRQSQSLLSPTQISYRKQGFLTSAELVVAFDIGFSDRVHLIPHVSAEPFYGDASFTWTTDTVLYKGGLDVSF